MQTDDFSIFLDYISSFLFSRTDVNHPFKCVCVRRIEPDAKTEKRENNNINTVAWESSRV